MVTNKIEEEEEEESLKEKVKDVFKKR